MREITKYNFDEWLFDYFEGALSTADQQVLKNFVAANADFQKEFGLWQKTYVANDNVEMPENIETLFTKPAVLKNNLRIIFIALLLILLAALFFLFFNRKKEENKIPFQNKVSTVQTLVQQEIETKEENLQNSTANKTTVQSPVKTTTSVVENSAMTPAPSMKQIPDSLMRDKLPFFQASHNIWAVKVLDSLELQYDSSLVHHKVFDHSRFVELEQQMEAVADTWVFKAGLFILKNIMNGNIQLRNGSNSTKNNGGNTFTPTGHEKNWTR